jgi:uncharacterized protein YsxB (DUF464 family)
MSTGLFVSKLVNAAQSANLNNLETVRFATLGHINILNEIKHKDKESILAGIVVLCSVISAIIFNFVTYINTTRRKSTNDEYEI